MKKVYKCMLAVAALGGLLFAINKIIKGVRKV
jgi:hypothetical protein